MGGHAFPYLRCPRMRPQLYLRTRQQTTAALRNLFKNVAVPDEMPSKTDYGDVDFLVSGFLFAEADADQDWSAMVSRIKGAFNTEYGTRGYLNPSVMYFAIPSPDLEGSFWIQIDVKVCVPSDKKTFEWNKFQLNYASGSKMIGSLAKPLGLTINPEGLFICVKEMEETNSAGSMVYVTREPRDVLKIVGLDRRILSNGFKSNDEIYKHFAESWIFNPAHFAARLEDEKYVDHLEDRSAPWVDFVTKWIPEHYPGYRFSNQNLTLQEWYNSMRAAVREKVFTLSPLIATEYYAKRAAHLKEVEEQRLQALLMNAIPSGMEGWRDDLPQPPIIKVDASSDSAADSCSDQPTYKPSTLPLTPPFTLGEMATISEASLETPLYLEMLSREPPIPYIPRPPPSSMSIEAKLLCLARWTHLDTKGTPYLACEPREKKFEMCWSDSGLKDEVLVAWAKAMWWPIWTRQARVNYVGMWKKRHKKEDAEKAKQADPEHKVTCDDSIGIQTTKITRAENKVEELPEVREEMNAGTVPAEVTERKKKILARLRVLNGGSMVTS